MLIINRAINAIKKINLSTALVKTLMLQGFDLWRTGHLDKQASKKHTRSSKVMLLQ